MDHKQKMNPHSRRQCLFWMGGVTSASVLLPNTWVKPIVNSVLLPAHAQTSCSGTVVEPINSSINMVVTATEVQGPIVANFVSPTRFSGTESIIAGTCNNGAVMRQEVLFEGEIDSLNNQITGLLEVDVFCGDQLACEQRSTYVSTQTPVAPGNDLGTYTGPLTGTSSCCIDFVTTAADFQLKTN